MGIKLQFKEKSASSFMEYVIILGVASAVLIGMNTYLKRGIQARLKDMTDYFIGPTQLVEINPTLSQTNTISEATINNEILTGGGAREGRVETRNIQARSSVRDIEPLFQAPVSDGESSVVISPPPTPVQTQSTAQGGK